MNPDFSPIVSLFRNTRIRNLAKGQILIYEGDPITSLYCVERGYIKVYNLLNTGAERIIFIYGPGDIFPLTSYLSRSGAARYFYETMTEADIYTLPPEVLESKVRDDVMLGEALITYTNHVNNQFLQRIETLSMGSSRQKLVALLSFLVGQTGSINKAGRLNIPLTHQDLANMCGLTRETASLQLLQLKKEGVVRGSKNLVINTSKLADVMSSEA